MLNKITKLLSKQVLSKKDNELNKKLSYQSLRCVLEHLEANRRIHITARCPYLQKIERTIPLHINVLELDESKFKLNKVDYVFQKLKRDFYSKGKQIYSYDDIYYKSYPETFDSYGVMTPGDILMKSPNDTEEEILDNLSRSYRFDRINITFKVDSKETYHRLLPSSFELHDAMKKLTTHIFGRRRDIRVRKLQMFSDNTRILRLPLNLRFQVNELWAAYENIESLRPIMTGESFPLKLLSIIEHVDESSLDDPIIQTAEKLIFGHISLGKLLKMPNQRLHLHGIYFSDIEIVEIVKNTLNFRKSIGKCYYFHFDPSIVCPSFTTILKMIKEQNFPKTTDSGIKSNERHGNCQQESVYFTISETTSLEITAGKGFEENGIIDYFRIEVVPIKVL